MATLTRDEMAAALNAGGSVMHQGRIITRTEHLPSEADLAEGDAAAGQAALDNIELAQAALDAQRTKALASLAKGKDKAAAATPGGGKGKSTPAEEPPK